MLIDKLLYETSVVRKRDNISFRLVSVCQSISPVQLINVNFRAVVLTTFIYLLNDSWNSIVILMKIHNCYLTCVFFLLLSDNTLGKVLQFIPCVSILQGNNPCRNIGNKKCNGIIISLRKTVKN